MIVNELAFIGIMLISSNNQRVSISNLFAHLIIHLSTYNTRTHTQTSDEIENGSINWVAAAWAARKGGFSSSC